MSVKLIDKRRPSERISGLGLPNGTWFKVLSISGMDKVIDTKHTNDPLNVSPAKAKKMACIIEPWTPPNGWVNGDDKDSHNEMKTYLIDFLRNCKGFRSH
ncbi:DUF7739 domain-containing protein [Hafnia sp.]|uniref:DUF7739 domain-containing protein n=1 Tax=Hafnia sp. TaxID=1873498 RepID=UPI002FC6A67C